MRASLTILALPMLALAGCATGSDALTGGDTAGRATVRLSDATANARGSATIDEVDGGLRVTVAAEGLPPGPHGLHLHTVGRCDPPGFETAGGHWNPRAAKHGKDAAGGPHAGDLPNLEIGANGAGRAIATIPGTLRGEGGLLDADGSALIVHAMADDYRTDPSGNSGGRIACGTVTAAR